MDDAVATLLAADDIVHFAIETEFPFMHPLHAFAVAQMPGRRESDAMQFRIGNAGLDRALHLPLQLLLLHLE